VRNKRAIFILEF